MDPPRAYTRSRFAMFIREARQFPNILSLSRTLALPLVVYAYRHASAFFFTALMIAVSATDAVDGYFARKSPIKTHFNFDDIGDIPFLFTVSFLAAHIVYTRGYEVLWWAFGFDIAFTCCLMVYAAVVRKEVYGAHTILLKILSPLFFTAFLLMYNGWVAPRYISWVMNGILIYYAVAITEGAALFFMFKPIDGQRPRSLLGAIRRTRHANTDR